MHYPRRALRLPSEASPLAICKQSSMMLCNFVPAVTILRLSTRSNLSAIASQPSQATCDSKKNTHKCVPPTKQEEQPLTKLQIRNTGPPNLQILHGTTNGKCLYSLCFQCSWISKILDDIIKHNLISVNNKNYNK